MPLPSINLQLRCASWDQGRPWLPFLLRVQQYLYEMPYSKSTEALTNVSYLPAWTNTGCGSILKHWIWVVFPWSTCGKSVHAFSNKMFCKCDSVWLRRAMAKLPYAPKEFSILLFIYFKIFYLLIFLLLFWRDFFSFSFWVLDSAAPSCSLHSGNEEPFQPCALRANNWAVHELGWRERRQLCQEALARRLFWDNIWYHFKELGDGKDRALWALSHSLFYY